MYLSMKGDIDMAKKSIVTSIRLNEDDYLKLKALKEEYNLSWTKFVSYVNELLENEMNKDRRDYHDK